MIKFQLPGSFRAALAAVGFVAVAIIASQVRAADAPVSNDRAVFAGSIRVATYQSVAPVAAAAAVDQAESMEFMIALKMRNYRELTARIALGAVISPDEMAAKYYPLESDYTKVVDWLKAEGFTITKTDPARLGVFARGAVAQLKASLQVDFTRVDSAGRTYTSAATAPSLPVSIAPAVLGINGLQPEIQPRRHSRRFTPAFQTQTSNAPPFYPREILKAYNADTLTANGSGQKIGIVIDTFPLDSDLTSFWAQSGVTNSLSNIEKVQVVSGTLPPPSGEETLDVEWASGIAPGAKVRVYASHDLSFVSIDQVFQQIVNDLPTQTGMKQISISLGLGETFLSSSQLQTDSQYMAAIAAGGVTICVSSGDSGSNEGGTLQVSYFASDPNVAGIGGTSLFLNGSTGAVSAETVWSGSGGGISTLFNRPGWQAGTGVPVGGKRLVPDVSAVADPNTGGFVVLNGSIVQFGGTSWSAPVWAGFCARINQGRVAASMSPLGVLGPRVYPLMGTSSFRDITSGSNGAYGATAGYDLCTGIGVPHMGNLYNALTVPLTQPNLQPAQPSGWSDTIVVSKTTGTNTDDLLSPADTVYVDFGFANIGGVPTSGTFSTELYVDNVLKGTFQTTSPLAVGAFSTVTDVSIGKLAIGTHTLRIKVDSGNSIAEVSEADNEFTKTITVTPPLLFDTVIGATFTSPTVNSSTPHTFMGVAFTLGSMGGTTNISVTGGLAYLRSTSTTNYTNIRLNVYFWGAASGATSGSTPGFSNPLGVYSFDLGPLNAVSGTDYPYTFTLPAPVVFPAQGGGITFNWQGNTGAGLVSTDNLTSTVRSGGAPNVGLLTFSGYYRNVFGETNGNFIGDDYRTLGGSNEGLAFQLYGSGLPAFTASPQSQTVGVGGSATFTVTAIGNPTPTYQWQRQPSGQTGFVDISNGGNFAGTTTAQLTVSNLALAMSGDQFRCVATNSVGSATSTAATLTVNTAPTISQQPTDTTVVAGQPATLGVTATATGALTYQWYRNGLPIASATGATLAWGTTHVSDNGNYHAVVSANGLQVVSTVVTLTVAPTRYPSAMYIDPTFSPAIESMGGFIFAIAPQPDGKLLIGGERMRVNGSTLRAIARLNVDGSLDSSFDPGLGPNDAIRAIVLQPDGKILIGGDFITVDGITRGRLARLNANGSLDSGFDTRVGANDWVTSLALAADGSVMAGGFFTQMNGVTRNHLVRLSPTGAVLTSFDPGAGTGTDGNTSVDAIFFQSDGKLVISGYFTSYAGVSRRNVARINASGSLDTSFNPSGSVSASDSVYALALQADGKILIGGYNSNTNYLLRRLNTDGSIDGTFNIGSGPNSPVDALFVQSDGKILVGGGFSAFNGVSRSRFARLNIDGGLDSFVAGTSDMYGFLEAIAVMADGKIAIGGRFLDSTSGADITGLRRFTTTGARDPGFTVATTIPGVVYEMIQQPDGKLLLAGRFDSVNGVARKHAARLLATGALDTSFNPGTGFDSGVETMVLQSDGKVVFGGSFYFYNGASRTRLVRTNADGSLDNSFSPGAGPDNGITALAQQADGKFLIGGSFTAYGGTTRNHIARIKTDGSLDATFNPGTGANGWPLYDLTLQPDGRVLFAGWFTSYNGTTRNGIARIMPDGPLDTSFNPTSTSYGNSLVLQPDGKVVFASGISLARLLANGGADSTFVAPASFARQSQSIVTRQLADALRVPTRGRGRGTEGVVTLIQPQVLGGLDVGIVGAMFRQPDGKILLGQEINSLATPTPVGIGRLMANGAFDSSFSAGGIFDVKITRFIMLDDGQLLVAGGLFDDGVSQQSGLARLTYQVTPTIATPPVAQTVALGGTATFTVAGSGGGLQYQWLFNGTPISGATAAKLTLTNITTANAGPYSVTVSNGVSSVTSSAVALTVLVPPAIVNQPVSRSVGVGGVHTFKVGATGTASLNYKWRKNGVEIAGATNSELPFAAVTVADAGPYDVVVTNTAGSVTSDTAVLTVLPNPSSFSSRQFISATGATASFALEGNQTKHLLLRAVGPGLTTFGVTGVLADPQISLLDANGVVIASNDNWGTVTGVNLGSIFAQVGAFPLASGSADAALYATLTPGSYQVKVSGVGATTGVALLELYDTDTNSSTRLAYVGMRGRMESSSGGLSAALAMKNSANKRMLIRAIGPTLGDASALADPQLQIYDGATTIASNDNWGNAPALVTAASQAGAFPLPTSSLDAALLIDQRIGTGSYLATVPYAGPNRDALLEIYDLNAAGVPAFAPLVVIPPVSVTELAQNPVTFRAFAIGGGTLAYQWQKNGVDIQGATSSTLIVPAPQAADAGFYVVKVSSSFGNATSSAATLTVPPGIGSFTPASAGQGATVTINGSGFTGATAVKFNGLNAASFTVVSNFQITAVVPTYATTGTISVTLADTSVVTSGAVLAILQGPHLVTMSQLVNSSGDESAALQAFTIRGAGKQQVLVRVVGPTLGAPPFNVSGVMTDPFLTIYDSTGLQIASNNDWDPVLKSAFSTVGAFGLPAGSKDSALLLNLDPGTYTARATGVGGTSGTVLFEVYEYPTGGSTDRFEYLSSRASVGSSGSVLTGFVIGFSSENTTVLIRAVGAGLGITGALADPILQVYQGNTLIVTNDNHTSTNVSQGALATATAAVGAMPLGQKDSAVLLTLSPGNYSVNVSSGGVPSQGVVLTEFFVVDGFVPVNFAPALLAPLQPKTPSVGETVTFAAPFVAKPAPSFKWQKGSVDIPGATNATFQLPSVTLADAGSYRVLMTNSSGTTTSASASLKMSPAVTWPTPAAIVYGTALSPTQLNATASVPGTFIYSPAAGTILNAGTNQTLSVTFNPTDTATYGSTTATTTITVTKATPVIAWSTPAAITYGTLLSSTQLNATASLGATNVPGTFVYSPAAGTKLNAGANPQALAVSFTPTDTTNYTDATGGTTILVNKASQTITFGAIPSRALNSGNFALGATSDSGLAITYATSNPSSGTVATISGSTVTLVNTGTITITASQAGDSNYLAATPVAQTLTVTEPPAPPPAPPPAAPPVVIVPTVVAPTITAQPASQQANAGSTVSFSVTATGNGLQFQWFKDGAVLSGAQGAVLTLTNIRTADAGGYSVLVSNAGGSVASGVATLTVLTPAPTIGSQPASQSVAFGANVVLGVTANGTAPFTYQWRKDGASIAGATGATLSLSGVTSSSAGAYTVVVTNAGGSITSNVAVLSVVPRPIAGSYFGTLGNNEGTFALFVRNDRTGVFLGYLNAARSALISRDVVIDANGRFSVTQVGGVSPAQSPAGTPSFAAAGASYRIDGAISPDGVLTGSVPELNLAFNAPPAASSGASASASGFYQSGAAGSSSTSYAIVGPAGDAFFVTVTGTTADAGKGTVSASGALNITTAANAVVTGTVQGATTMLSATVTPATGAATTFVGANDDTRTDVEKLINISTRSQTGTAVNTLIAGFVISGNQRKPVLVRAIGPTLGSAFGVGGALSAARLELFRGQTSIAVGADWGAQANAAGIADAAARVGAFALATSSHDASILVDLEPGAYTAVVTGQGGASGVSLVEVYDATSGSIPRDQRIINIATRATAGTGDNSLIAGFVISGSVPKRVLIRGVGPTLASFGLTGVLARPQLSVSSGATVLAQNAGWSTSPDAAAIAAGSAQVGAFTLGATSLDAALIVYLAPGAYTAQVSGAGNTTGVALIEVYELP